MDIDFRESFFFQLEIDEIIVLGISNFLELINLKFYLVIKSVRISLTAISIHRVYIYIYIIT